MNYSIFKEKLSGYPIFSIDMIYRFFPDLDKRRLFEWVKSEKLINIRQGRYCFPEYPKDSLFLMWMANHLYGPSYISLETALKYYNLIPETVITITSIATKKTTGFHTPLATFSYKSIKASLYNSYKLVKSPRGDISIASPAQAVCDYLYFHQDYDEDAFEQWRINVYELTNICSRDELMQESRRYNNATQKRVRKFISYCQSNA